MVSSWTGPYWDFEDPVVTGTFSESSTVHYYLLSQTRIEP